MTEVRIQLPLHENQLKVWESRSRFRVLVAGRRWGKTTLAITQLVLDALSQPGKYLWYVAPSYRQAKMIAWQKLKDIISPEFEPKYNESELSCRLSNGSRIELKGAENEESLLGVGLDGLVIDEFASIYDNWKVWHETLRPMLTDKAPQSWALFIGTPKGKDAFYELYLKATRGEHGWESFHFTSYDNPFLDPGEIDEAKAAMPERYFKQEFMASFEDFVGLIYPEYSENVHLIDPFPVPEEWARWGAIDPAMSGITAALKMAVAPDETMYFYDEYYQLNKRAGEVAQVIQAEDVKWIIDPASKARNATREGQLYSLYDEYGDNGIYAHTAENDVEAGINRVAEALKAHKIKIFSNCTNLLREIERYHWAETRESIKGDVKPEPYKKDDHLVDCLRYLVMERARSRTIRKERKAGVWSPAWELQQAKLAKGTEWEKKFV